MTHVQAVTAMFSEEDHPRAEDGKFGSGGGENSSKSTTKPRKAPTVPKSRGQVHRRAIPKGQLGFDGVRGTGYGMPHGDPRVRSLQAELNRLGLTNARGRKLAVDGKLGPLTTQAVMAAQRRLGMNPTGIVDPAFISRLKATKGLPKAAAPAKKTAPTRRAPAKKRPAKKAAPSKAADTRPLPEGVYAKYDPMQKRDGHGRWSKIGAALHAIAKAVGAPILGHETFGAEAGDSHSHGIVVAHPGGDFTLALPDKDSGARPLMVLPDDDAREEMRQGFEDVADAHRRDPASSGSIEADDGSWQVQYNEHGAVLYANIDDDAESEEVHLSHDDVETLESALANIGDALRNAEAPDYTPPLAPGEEVRPRSRKRLGSSGDEFVGAVEVVDTADRPRVRFGAIAQDENGIKNWTGGHGQTTVDLDQADAAKIADVLEGFDAAGKERQKIYDMVIGQAERAAEDGTDVDWNDVSADIVGRLGGDSEDDFGEKKVETPWGTIRLTDVGMDDEANAIHRHVRVEIWPTGMSEEEYDAGNPDHAEWAWPGSKWQKPVPQLQVKDIRALIKLLRDSFGEPVSAAKPVVAAEMRGIELARPGTWKLSSGVQTFTADHLRAAERYANRPGARPAPVKIGHVDPRFDGEPALGWVGNVRYAEDDRGPVLVGDITGMPDWLAAAAPKAWPDRSVEGWLDFTADDGEKFSFVVEALALLGVTPPGMSSIQSLRDLPKAVGIHAARGVRVVASMSPASVAEESEEKGAGLMDPAEIRKVLGLPAGASDEEVGSAMFVAAAAFKGEPDPAEPVQASLFGDEPAKPAPKAAAIPAGMMLVSASAWQQREDTIKNLTDFMAQSKRDDRDEYIAKAIKAGKFTPAQKIHFTKMWDGNPDATREYIDSMIPNSALAVMASGYAGEIENEADLDREFASLFPPVHQEARRG